MGAKDGSLHGLDEPRCQPLVYMGMEEGRDDVVNQETKRVMTSHLSGSATGGEAVRPSSDDSRVLASPLGRIDVSSASLSELESVQSLRRDMGFERRRPEGRTSTLLLRPSSGSEARQPRVPPTSHAADYSSIPSRWVENDVDIS